MDCSLGSVKPIVLPELWTSKITRRHLYIHINETLMKNEHWPVEHKKPLHKTFVCSQQQMHTKLACVQCTHHSVMHVSA